MSTSHGRWTSRLWSKVLFLGLAGMPALAGAAGGTIDLPGERAFPESVTSTQDGTLYVGSLGAGGVYKAPPGATRAAEWIKPAAYGSRAIFGVLADEKSNTLWACSNDVSFMGITVPGTAAGSYLKGFDLRSGAGKVSFKLPGQVALCNDIVVGPDGSVYVTNMIAPQILRLPPGGTELEVWMTDPAFQPVEHGSGLEGIAFGGDGNLYVVTNGAGNFYRIAVVNGKPGKLTQLQLSRALKLPDALRTVNGKGFLLVEDDGHLDRVTVKGDTANVDTLKDGFNASTGVTQVGSTAWVSEGQMNYLFDPSKRDQKPALPFHVVSVPLQE